MTVYVDTMRAPYGRLVMSHMVADSTAELLAMADRIGVARRWLQCAGTYREHFDVCQAKRAAAVRAGAVEISERELGAMLVRRRCGNDSILTRRGSGRGSDASSGVSRRGCGSASVPLHGTAGEHAGAEPPESRRVEDFKRRRNLGGTAIQAPRP